MSTNIRGFKERLLVLCLCLAFGTGITEAATVKEPVSGSKVALSKEAAFKTVISEPLNAVLNKSTLIRLPVSASRISVGNPAVADIVLISPNELYVLGKRIGSTNLILWSKDGVTTLMDIQVGIDVSELQNRLKEFLPGEKGIKVYSASDSIVLKGSVSDALKAAQAVDIAEAFIRNVSIPLEMAVKTGDGAAAVPMTSSGSQQTMGVGGQQGPSGTLRSRRVVNLLKILAPQQVILEVKVAEVSKTLLDKLGSTLGVSGISGRTTYGFNLTMPGTLALTGGTGGILSLLNATTNLKIDAERKNALVKVLAEPNIMAISGQEASFRAGGKIFIPVQRSYDNAGGGSGVTFTLEEKEFGIGVTFLPSVLEDNRINLKVASEVTELIQQGAPFATVNQVTAILPSMTVRRAATTVQLGDGQSFAIAGLIKNNVTENLNRFPLLGEIPILGVLFRSTEFQEDRTELLFVVTPRLVKPLPPDYALPTDHFVPPSRGELFLEGRTEAKSPNEQDVPDQKPDNKPQALPASPGRPEAEAGSPRSKADPDGFLMK